MDDNNVLKGLKDLINNARKLKIDYGITGQEINRENNNIITFSSNTTMEVDYIEKKGYRETIRSDFSGTYTTNEVFENYFVAERFTNLSYAKRNFHAVRLNDALKICKNSLACFRTQVNKVAVIGKRSLISFKHQVKLANCSIFFVF